jgi:hypothetical protein
MTTAEATTTTTTNTNNWAVFTCTKTSNLFQYLRKNYRDRAVAAAQPDDGKSDTLFDLCDEICGEEGVMFNDFDKPANPVEAMSEDEFHCLEWDQLRMALRAPGDAQEFLFWTPEAATTYRYLMETAGDRARALVEEHVLTQQQWTELGVHLDDDVPRLDEEAAGEKLKGLLLELAGPFATSRVMQQWIRYTHWGRVAEAVCNRIPLDVIH